MRSYFILIMSLILVFNSFSLKYHGSQIRYSLIQKSSSLSLSSRLIIDNVDKTLKIRPTIDDIEKISYGQAAKRRGTGSRGVPHRLNNLERKEWDLAKRRRYLLLRGTGWRKERGDSPLANIYRNYCDAVAVPCISVCRGVQSGTLLFDELIVDFSPLRLLDVTAIANSCIETMKLFNSLIDIEDSSDISKLGWANSSGLLHDEVIWRIPYYGISGRYTNRKECKEIAEKLAFSLADGERVANEEFSNNNDDDNEFE